MKPPDLKHHVQVLILIIGFQIPVNCHAQLSESDSLQRAFSFVATGNLSFGNVDRQLLFGSLQYVHRIGDSWTFKTQNSYRYGRINKGIVANDLILLNYMYFRPRNKLYPYAVILYETSIRKKIQDRLIGGIGLTLQALRNEDNLIKVSVTGVYETNDFADNNFKELGERSTSQISLGRVAFRMFGRHQLTEAFSVFYVGRLMSSLSDVGNTRISMTGGLDLKLNRVISFIARANFIYEDIVVENLRNEDLLITYGINVNLRSKT